MIARLPGFGIKNVQRDAPQSVILLEPFEFFRIYFKINNLYLNTIRGSGVSIFHNDQGDWRLSPRIRPNKILKFIELHTDIYSTTWDAQTSHSFSLASNTVDLCWVNHLIIFETRSQICGSGQPNMVIKAEERRI